MGAALRCDSYTNLPSIRTGQRVALRKMLEQNYTRMDFAQKLQEIIDRYNSGGSSNENYFDELIKFTQGLKEEDERHIREGLTEAELEVYDTLKKEKLTKAEEQAVKLAAKHLITRLLDKHPKVLVQILSTMGGYSNMVSRKESFLHIMMELLDGLIPRSTSIYRMQA